MGSVGWLRSRGMAATMSSLPRVPSQLIEAETRHRIYVAKDLMISHRQLVFL